MKDASEISQRSAIAIALAIIVLVVAVRHFTVSFLSSRAFILERPPVGNLDGVWPNGLILGWALDQDTPDEAVTVHFYLDGPAGQGGKLIGFTDANVMRSDVNQVMRVAGAHGFEWFVPGAYLDGKQHLIYTYGINTGEGNNALLNGAPRSVVFNTSNGIAILPSGGGSGVQPLAGGGFELVGAPEVVFDYTTDRCWNEDLPDTPARAFRASDGRVNLLASHYITYRMTGSTLNNVKRDCAPVMPSLEDPDFDKFKFREWITGLYTEDGRNVYALVHNEWYAYLSDPNCKPVDQIDGWVNAITLAESHDGGASYNNPYDYVIAKPPLEWKSGYSCKSNAYTRFGAFSPTNVVKKDGYYYSMFQSEADPNGVLSWGTCLMRTNRIDSAAAWQIWTNHGWDDNSGAVCLPIARERIEKMHESLTYNTYLGAYLLMGVKFSPNQGVYYSTSKDLFNWSEPVRILSAEVIYPSVIDPADTSRNFENSGREPYIYYTHYNNGNTGFDRDLMRQKIRFTVAGATPTPLLIATPTPTPTVVPVPVVTNNPFSRKVCRVFDIGCNLRRLY